MELILRQVLVIPELPLFETCVITTNTSISSNIAEPLGKDAEIQQSRPMDNNDNGTTISAKELIETLDKSLGNPESSLEYASMASPASPESSTLKHFECTEVDIDFKNISDVIDTEEPVFDVPPLAASAAATSTAATWKQNNNSVTLKKHKEVIYEMYKVAKRKAQEAKKTAIRAYLEAKEIKASYLLDDFDDFDSETDDDI
jgi:hypothetical protein